MSQEKQRRGFALMDKEKLRRISSKGGVIVQALGVGHRITPEKGREMSLKAVANRRARKALAA